MPATRHILISEIKIGKRVRKDLGDLEELADSIRANGLIQPIIVNSRLELVSGMRRLKALLKLGRTEVDVYIPDSFDDLLSMLKAEYAENACRKEMTPSEKVMATSLLWKEEQKRSDRAKTLGRKGYRFNEGKHAPREIAGQEPPAEDVEIFPKVGTKARDRVAQTVGMSGRTLIKAREVVAAAEADPKQFGPAKAEMDRTGKVDRAYQTVHARVLAVRTAYEDWNDLITAFRKRLGKILERRGSLEAMASRLPKGQKRLLREPLSRLLTDLNRFADLLAG